MNVTHRPPIEALSQILGEVKEELICPDAPGFPEGFGLRLHSTNPIDVVSALGSKEAYVLLERARVHEFLVLVNTKPRGDDGPKVWGTNEPNRFIPPHIDTISPFTAVQLADPTKPRPYPTSFTSIEAFNSVLKKSSNIYEHWGDLNDDYIFAYDASKRASSREGLTFEKGLARLRKKTREALAECSPIYEHDWTEWPRSTVIFSNKGKLLHGRIIPEIYNQIPPSQLGVVLNWFIDRSFTLKP